MQDELIYESGKSKIYFRPDSEWNSPVIIKVLNYEFPTPADIAQFYNEYELLCDYRLPGIRNVLKKGKEKNRHALYLEWIEGESLAAAFRGKQNDIADFLYIAIATTEALREIHGIRIAHKDITPYNIIVNLQDRRVGIIDFGNSTNLELKQHFVGNPERLDGTLSYISPEQTGRMNRIVDYRTDLYSLGVTFYEMLTGRLPFTARDPMELVHAHIAHIPVPPHQVNPKIPEPLSAIVSKLLSKNAEDRYQSANGLLYDLKYCLDQLISKGQIDPFDTGKQDFSGRFQLPQKLYGREKETAAIMDSFSRCAEGAAELLLVAGYSGTGKSALVHEVHKPVTARRGYFVSGKFDQFQRIVPYYAIIEAFKELIDLILIENEANLERFRHTIQLAVGEEGKVLTNVIPNLELIIGPQPDIPEVGGSEAQNRFNYVIRKFVHSLCTRDHPLVLFIDDLQWADSASLQLLQVLLTDPQMGFLLCIGAYRDNEVSAAHPAMMAVHDIRETGAVVHTLEIGNLPEDQVQHLIADTLLTTPSEAASLTDLVFEKTKGNAFFLTQFLKSIYEEKLLHFDFEQASWQWDIDKIREKNISDNVVELMTSKIKRFPAATQEVLKAGACIGNSFSLEMLSIVMQQDVVSLKGAFKPGFEEGLLIPLGGERIKFAHDRIQQAVYALMEEDQRKAAHLQIGRLIWHNSQEEKREAQLFDIVNQLNSGRDLIDDPEEQILLSKLNLRAGRKAKQNSAFQPSFDYLNTGIGLLPDQAWQQQYDLSLALFTEACEAAYLNGEFDKMEQLFQEILSHARDILEKVKPYEIRILAYKAQNKLHDAIQTGLEVLRQLGEHFPARPNLYHVLRDLMITMFRLRNKDNQHLIHLPLMADPRKIAAMRIIADITSSVYWGMPNLLPLIVFRMVGLTLSYGNTAVSCFAYGSYGVIQCGVLGRMKQGNEYGRLALSLIDKLNAKEWKAQIYVSPYALTFHWRNHVRETLHPLQESFQIGLETGLIEFACINTNIYCIHSLLCGKPLPRLEEETNAYSRSYRQFKQETNYNYNEVYRQAMLNLLGRNTQTTLLTGEAYDEAKMIRQNEVRNDKTGAFFIHFLKTMLGYIYGELVLAKEQAEKAEALLDAVLAKFEIPSLHYYHALTCIALAEEAKGKARRTLLSKARSCRRKLHTWAKDAPMNFQHKVDLIDAEWHRLHGRTGEARIGYDKAIAGANEHEYLHEEALSYEVAGRFYLKQQSKDLAEYYLKAAYNTYREWGAEGKLHHLLQSYPKQLTGVNREIGQDPASAAMSSASTGLLGSALDIQTVLKASTTISGEVVLPKLLSLLLRIVIENAGAQRGLLLLENKGELLVEAHIETGFDEAEVLRHIPITSFPSVSTSIVHFVTRTRQNVVLQDAGRDNRFKNDEYIQRTQPKSILSLPVINQGKLIGVLYLENNLTTNAFTQDRVNILSMLSGQIAVSIDNAILYNQLEQKVQERTLELAAEKKKSDDLLYNILPFETAQELKQNGFAEAKQIEKVSILFTDFVGFTSLSEKLTPQQLVQELDTCFREFDEIINRHGVEKIKTIGDSYMAVGGLPIPNSTHAVDVVNAALDIRDFMRKRKTALGEQAFELRIGINTGPVVAGIVGTKKFQYDIWGDAVNTASRMENSGLAGKVNISNTTYELVKHHFQCEYRGEIEAKGKGKINMYFAERKPTAN